MLHMSKTPVADADAPNKLTREENIPPNVSLKQQYRRGYMMYKHSKVSCLYQLLAVVTESRLRHSHGIEDISESLVATVQKSHQSEV